MLLTSFLIALFFRAYFQFDPVFRQAYVSFQENDSWYHVRAVEHLVANFPHRLTWDPFALHPGGQHIAIAPLFDWLCAGIALLLGGGSPSVRLIHAVCAWAPAILGSLIVVPVYFLGKTLRDARAGLIAAATIAVLSGAFLQRSLLGHADHHVAESFFAITTILFLTRLLRGWREHPDRRHVRDGLLFGCSLGLYLLSWVGGALIVLFVFVSLVLYAMLEYGLGRPVGKACVSSAAALVVTLAMVAPFSELPGFDYHVVAVVGAAMFLILTAGWARLVRWHPRIYMPMGLLVLGMIGPLLVRLVAPGIFAEVLGAMVRFASGSAGLYVSEAGPLLFEGRSVTLMPAYEAFGTTPVAALVAIVALAYAVCRGRGTHALPFLAYSALMILVTLTQQRFAYYLAVNLAVLVGWFWSMLLDGLQGWLGPRGRALRIGRTAAYATLAAFGLYPSARAAYAFSRQHNGPHADWHAAMTWLRSNSPDPFEDPDAFTRPYDERTGSPRCLYGVMCWWDHGYWITAMAHRVPVSNPTQTGVAEAAAFFTAQDEDHAVQILEKLNARYVVVDDSLPSWESADHRFEGKFGTLALWTGKNEFDLYEPYLVPDDDGGFRPAVLYYPDYYRSMLNRLFLFRAEGYEPTWSTWAVRYTEVVTPRGFRVKRAEQTLQFKTHEKAVEHLADHPDEKWRIVGLKPGQSCVPLEPLRRIRPVYQSPTPSGGFSDRSASVVEIFVLEGK